MGAPRALEIDRGLFAIVADAPESRYNQAAIDRGLADLDWVSRAAVAHEAVIEHFIDERAVLPMKLFTIFSSDDRALAHLRRERSRLVAAAKRVSGHLEWGLRVLFDRSRAAESVVELRHAVNRTRGRATARTMDGIAYLATKKASRDAAAELTTRARDTAAGLYDRLAKKARAARKRTPNDLAAQQGTLLLDAAFLVPRSRLAAFRSTAAKEAKTLAPRGYAVTITGPWPPYTFVQD
jgi:gas vesicle protein GvpL/GvpF